MAAPRVISNIDSTTTPLPPSTFSSTRKLKNNKLRKQQPNDKLKILKQRLDINKQDTPSLVDSSYDADYENDNLNNEEDESNEISAGSSDYSSNAISNSIDAKDKRRHYLIKSKQFLHLGIY